MFVLVDAKQHAHGHDPPLPCWVALVREHRGWLLATVGRALSPCHRDGLAVTSPAVVGCSGCFMEAETGTGPPFRRHIGLTVVRTWNLSG